MERVIVPNPIVKKLKEMVKVLLSTLPVIQNMRNSTLRDRHWKKMEGIIGCKVEKTINIYLHKINLIYFQHI